MKKIAQLTLLILLTLASYNATSQNITKDSIVILSHNQAKEVVKDLEERKYLKQEVKEYEQLVGYYENYQQRCDSVNKILAQKLDIKDNLLKNQKEITNLQRKEIKQVEAALKEEKKKKWLFGGGVGLLGFLIILL